MTTTVTVAAHCDKEKKQVRVAITGSEAQEDITILQDGESADFYAYDGREITVREILK